MSLLSGQIESRGPFLDVTASISAYHADYLKKAGRPIPAPVTIRALIDTGASISVLDAEIIGRLGLVLVGTVPIHTPSTGSDYADHSQHEASFFLGTIAPDVKAFNVAVISASLANQGFVAIIGWDVLIHCVLICDGPNKKFELEF